jgi:hypothetical protein
VGNDTWGLLGQVFRRENHLGLQGDLVSDMLAVANLTYIPLFLRHPAPPDYAIIV